MLWAILFSSHFFSQSDDQNKINVLIKEGVYLSDQGLIKESSKKLIQALEKSKEINYKYGIGYSSFHLAYNYSESQPAKSHKLASDALKIAEDINNKELESHSSALLGRVLQYLGDLERALYFNFKALEIFKELKNNYYEITTLIQISSIKSILYQYNEASDYMKRAISKAKHSNNPELILSAQYALSAIYASQNKDDLSGPVVKTKSDLFLRCKSLIMPQP